MKFGWMAMLGLTLFFQTGCEQKKQQQAASDAAPAPAPQEHQSPSAPQPRLPTIKLWLGSQEITAEIAATPSAVETGMMWRTNMAEMEGMIFVFARPHQASFWMRNTLLPLSCAYIDSDGIILEEHDMKPKDETPIVANAGNVRYVLEMKQGWFARNRVPPGTLVKTERGTLGQTFFSR
jgi:uncharacterized membrane protein (UPF0127 family)